MLNTRKEDTMANARGQIRWQFAQGQMRWQFGELQTGNCKRGRVLMTTDGRIVKRRFGLVVRLIANEDYMDLFRYLYYLLTSRCLP